MGDEGVLAVDVLQLEIMKHAAALAHRLFGDRQNAFLLGFDYDCLFVDRALRFRGLLALTYVGISDKVRAYSILSVLAYRVDLLFVFYWQVVCYAPVGVAMGAYLVLELADPHLQLKVVVALLLKLGAHAF